MLLGCLVLCPAIIAQDLSTTRDPILTLEEAASPHEFFAQFGADYTPPVSTVALIESVGDDVILFDREVNGMQLTIYWDSAIGGLEVWKDGDWIDDLRVQYGDRIVFSGGYEVRSYPKTASVAIPETPRTRGLRKRGRELRQANSGLEIGSRMNRKSEAVTLVATVTGSIVAGPEGTVIVDVLNYRGVVPVGGVSAAGDEGGPLPDDSGLATCNCFGLGPETKKCTGQNCTEGVSCGKNRACRWSSPTA